MANIRETNKKIENAVVGAYQKVENAVMEAGKDMETLTMAELDEIWDGIKHKHD